MITWRFRRRNATTSFTILKVWFYIKTQSQRDVVNEIYTNRVGIIYTDRHNSRVDRCSAQHSRRTNVSYY